MNLSELLSQITDLQKDSEMLNEIVKLVGGKKKDVVVNLTDSQPINRAKILDEISDIRHLVSTVEEEYEGVYDEMCGAKDTLDYMASELDAVHDAKNRLDDLTDMLEVIEEAEEEPVKNDTEVVQDRIAQENQDNTIDITPQQ